MIYELLGDGFENKVTTPELMDRLGLSRREVIAQVQRERNKEGKIILSTKADGGGYYRPSSVEEMQIFYRGMRKEALSRLHILTSVRRKIKEKGGEV